MEKLNSVIFYSLDKAIKTYRNFAQKRLISHGFKITIDQWLTIKAIGENPGLTQQEIAVMVFKDNASITRIIDILVRDHYLQRQIDSSDRRKSVLKVTKEGKNIIKDVQELVFDNRKIALSGISANELETMQEALKKIIDNCNS